MTFEEVRQTALAMEQVEEGASYGTPGFKIRGSLIARWRPDIEALVVKCSFEQRDELVAADPNTYFVLDHYLNYEWVLVRVSRIAPDALHDLLLGARRAALEEKRRGKRK